MLSTFCNYQFIKPSVSLLYGILALTSPEQALNGIKINANCGIVQQGTLIDSLTVGSCNSKQIYKHLLP